MTTEERETKSAQWRKDHLGKNAVLSGVSNFVLLDKPNYKAKDGTIKRGIEIDGKYYAPQNDC